MKKTPTFTSSIQVNSLSSKGYGVGSVQKTPASQVAKVKIPHTIPGDEIIAEMGSKVKGAFRGRLLEITKESPDRREAKCIHEGACGGCSLQCMKYEKQLSYKENFVRGLFKDLFEKDIFPIISSPLEWQYRNKMEYTFSQNKEGDKFLGLMKAATKGRVETLNECHLSSKWFIAALQAAKNWWENSEILAYQRTRDTGSLRTLTVREGQRTGEKMVMLTVSGHSDYALKKEQLTEFVRCIREAVGDEKLSIFLQVHQAIKGQVTQFFEMNLFGPDHIEEELEISYQDYLKKYRFKISPTAFFQPNTLQAERLYSKALEIAGAKKRSVVLDLYAGTATLGMVFSPFAEKVISVELNPYAVFDAEVNREINQVDNLQVFKGDVAKVLKDLRDQDKAFRQPDLIVLDPPRTGLSPQAIDVVLEANPSEILYISCAPKMQARDCALLKEGGYIIAAVQPLDQFPHTVHIENIVLMKKR